MLRLILVASVITLLWGSAYHSQGNPAAGSKPSKRQHPQS